MFSPPQTRAKETEMSADATHSILLPSATILKLLQKTSAGDELKIDSGGLPAAVYMMLSLGGSEE